MSSDPSAPSRPSRALEARGVSKRYALGTITSHRTLRSGLEGAVRGVFRLSPRTRTDTTHLWALKDVTFDIDHGEVVGIIGRNGAGKSTLLRILSGITSPTEGRIDVWGRVGALLEVGTGFHPELTGRENIYLTGAILGIGRSDLDRRFDEIVAFSGLEKFLETPIKHFSSGMQLRLAFSVSAHLRPDILIIDEILAVGDAEFQAKCLAKLAEHVDDGRTVLFTSHDLGSVRSFCSRALWFDRGRLMADGPAEDVIARYLRTARSDESASDPDSPLLASDIDEGFGGVTELAVHDASGSPRASFHIGERWWIRIDFRMWRRVEDVVAGVTVELPPAGALLTFRSHPCDLDAGRYYVMFEVTSDLRTGDVRLVPHLTSGLACFYRAQGITGARIGRTTAPGSAVKLLDDDLLAMPPTATIWGAGDP